jgi:pimeloyl-ACP methyl ester carboxylesterase
MNRIRIGVLVGACVLWSCADISQVDEAADDSVAASAEALRTSSFSFDVVLRNTGHATIHAVEYIDKNKAKGDTVLAIHGLTETDTTFEPLARAVFAQKKLRKEVGRIIAISLPGHGDSPFPSALPTGVQFGQLLIQDNVLVVIQAIDALIARGTPAQVIVGHSMGGLAVAVAHYVLQGQGTGLSGKGIELAVLLAPVPPHGQPWTQPPPFDVSPFLVQDPVQGTYFALSDEAWVSQAFTTRAGTRVASAPKPADVAALGYNGFEPFSTLAQLTESPIPLPDGSTTTIPRPSVSGGTFDPSAGTELIIVSFSEDTLVPAANLERLYLYLTSDSKKKNYYPVVSPDAVHSMFISNPRGLLRAVFE